jgi:hypothetical protein
MALILTDLDRRASGFSPQERLERLAAISSERMNWALMYLSGYAPAVFDAVIDMAEPCGGDDPDGWDETESYCVRCGQEIEIAPHLTLIWRHLSDHDGSPLSSPGTDGAGHAPVAAWRPAGALPW